MKQRKLKIFGGWRGKAILILTLILAVGVGSAILYSAVTGQVIDLSVRSMDELTLHDETAILKSLDFRWKTLAAIGDECRQTKCETIRELLELLNLKGSGIDCIDLALVDEERSLYFGSMFISTDENITAFCETDEDHFAVRYDGVGQSIESRSECLLFGVRVNPFTVEDKTFTHLISRFHINELDDELKIDCYGGEGYSSVFDRDGNYIVNLNRSHSISKRDNFFTDMAQNRLEDGMTVEEIRARIERNEAFTVSFETDRGGELMRFTPIEEADWYLVMSVSRSVFEKQSVYLLEIVLLIFIAMGAAVVLILLLVLRERQSAARARVDQRHREELNDALALAESANRAKTTFLNNMSHDIRTPMNAIIGFTALASKHLGETELLKSYLDKIDRSSAHLLSLINDVLDMSRIESGKVVIEEKPENLAEILRNIQNIIQTDMSAKELEFKIETENVTHENIYCDKLRLNQILLNLLSNAMKFTPAGGCVSLRLVEKESGREDRGDYALSVKDNGIGMSPEFAATIFEPFTREQTATVSGIQGTGLGMSITKNLVELMNGTIRVESEKDRGTEFTIDLSFRLDTSEKEVAPAEEKAEESVSFKGRRLLLVEDNELNREIATELLEEWGFIIESAENGREAVDAVKTSAPGYFDAILMDVQMPVMDGYEASRAIRAIDDPALSKILIIAMTANAFEEDKKEAFAAGMNDHLGKPIDIPILLETLKKYLS
ncbi:MAG: ATP-binding protein [Bacteroides sp.]|nr:ATP-binding protein [Eubacterium sp.]MCM1417918.1 ATP-binding protein [Roseburia sp.]MCM1461919.1 ATP-binding protein [Bacteroides sp.]